MVIIPISYVIVGIKLGITLREDALAHRGLARKLGLLLNLPPQALHVPIRNIVILQLRNSQQLLEDVHPSSERKKSQRIHILYKQAELSPKQSGFSY